MGSSKTLRCLIFVLTFSLNIEMFNESEILFFVMRIVIYDSFGSDSG